MNTNAATFTATGGFTLCEMKYRHRALVHSQNQKKENNKQSFVLEKLRLILLFFTSEFVPTMEQLFDADRLRCAWLHFVQFIPGDYVSLLRGLVLL